MRWRQHCSEDLLLKGVYLKVCFWAQDRQNEMNRQSGVLNFRKNGNSAKNTEVLSRMCENMHKFGVPQYVVG